MIEMFQVGGPLMWVLLIVALVGLSIFLERLFHLHRAQIKQDDFLKGIYNIMDKGNVTEAVTICEDTPGPVACIVRSAVLHYDSSDAEITKAVEKAGLAEVPRLEHNLNMLATIAKIAPLTGLFGTVLGLMDLFRGLQHGAPLVHMGDLSAGMMSALLTSAAGLAIAIPAYAAYNFLIGRVESIMLDMERSSLEVQSYLAQRKDS